MNIAAVVAIESIEFPDELFDSVMGQVNKGFIEDSFIQEWIIEEVLPRVLHKLDVRPDLYPCANHAHIGSAGLEAHDHLPHSFTSVLYLSDSSGHLVLNPGEPNEFKILPKAGLFVFFPAATIHLVECSVDTDIDFRLSLVTNYEYPETI